jgi:hypothetical protein
MTLQDDKQTLRSFPPDRQPTNEVANETDAIPGGCRSRKRGRSTSPRHGLTRLKTAVRRLGGRVVDRRTTLGKALAEWRQELIQDLGGLDAVSTQEKAVIELAVKTKLLLDSIDAWLLTQPSLVNARRRTLLPVVVQRQQLADALARYMNMLGLKRRRERLDLAQSLAQMVDEGRDES